MNRKEKIKKSITWWIDTEICVSCFIDNYVTNCYGEVEGDLGIIGMPTRKELHLCLAEVINEKQLRLEDSGIGPMLISINPKREVKLEKIYTAYDIASLYCEGDFSE